MKATRIAPSVAPISSARGPDMLNPATRCGLWTLLVVIQLVNAVLLGVLAALYFGRTQQGALLWTAAVYYLFADAYAFIDSLYLVLAVVYLLFCTAFALSGVRLVYLSLRSRRIRFGPRDQPTQRELFLQSRPHNALLSAVFTPFRFDEWTATSRSRRVMEWMESVKFTTGIHGPLFNLRLFSEQVISIITQTIAAYSASLSISNVALNHTYGSVLFLSCISTPILHRVLRRSGRTQQRLSYLVADLVLDFVWGTVVPIWLHFRLVYSGYEKLTDLATSAREMERVLVLSWGSFIVSLVPFISSIACCLEIQAVLCQKWAPLPPPQPKRLIRKRPQHVGVASVLKRLARFAQKQYLIAAHVMIGLYGCAILAVSLTANDVLGRIVPQPLYPCLFPLHPWFSTKEACVKRYINCTTLGIEGRTAELEMAFELFDLGSLSDLHLQSCPALEMPTTLYKFSMLIRLVVRKSWIAEWSLDANISYQVTPYVKVVKLMRSNTNATLHGLVSAPISKSIEEVRFFKVPNADAILRPVGSNWQHLHFFECDECDLPDVPRAVDAMKQLLLLSLMDSRIAYFRDNWIASSNVQLIGIWLDGNANLTELSDTVWRQSAYAAVFSMQNTNLSFIPEWLPTVARTDFMLLGGHGSPVCDPTANVLREVSPKVRQLVNCDE
jgi:hypothetical protein